MNIYLMATDSRYKFQREEFKLLPSSIHSFHVTQEAKTCVHVRKTSLLLMAYKFITAGLCVSCHWSLSCPKGTGRTEGAENIWNPRLLSSWSPCGKSLLDPCIFRFSIRTLEHFSCFFRVLNFFDKIPGILKLSGNLATGLQYYY